MKINYFFFLWLILTLGSCNKTNSPGPPSDGDVYIIGGGRFWKNNKPFDLPRTDGPYGEVVVSTTGIAVSGNDLYISGSERSVENYLNGYDHISKYWKNGVSVNLTDGTTYASATGISVSGGDVYVCGTESSADLQQSFAKYWKNGVGVTLPNINPTGIAVTGTDIYISGEMRDSLTGHTIAVYLKNGIPVRLSDGSLDAHANAMVVDGSDIYIAGDDGPRAVYWKNQVPDYVSDGLSDSLRLSTLRSIAVEGSDVFLAGNIGIGEPGHPGSLGTYWKNGIPITVGEGVVLSGIASAGNNVYFVGKITLPQFPYFEPGYWINDERQTNIDQSASFSQILVIKH